MNNIITLVRALIGDQDSIDYEDEVLYRLIVVAALLISQEIHFNESYNINIQNATITPHPDNNFSLFASYKTAILLLQAEIKKASKNSIKIIDGPSTVDLTNTVKSLQENLKSYLEQYDKLKMEFNMSGALGYAVITPTTVEYIPYSEFS